MYIWDASLCQDVNINMETAITRKEEKAKIKKEREAAKAAAEEEARKHGVHLIWVTHNLMCPEDGSRRDMRTEINRYMRTVFREEPLDPTLEDFDDKQNW